MGRTKQCANDHRIEEFATGSDEVFCPETIMSTWRYCPYCGVSLVDDED